MLVNLRAFLTTFGTEHLGDQHEQTISALARRQSATAWARWWVTFDEQSMEIPRERRSRTQDITIAKGKIRWAGVSPALSRRPMRSISCSCPDSAGMCEHVAAMLYGVGARLDHRTISPGPEKRFPRPRESRPPPRSSAA